MVTKHGEHLLGHLGKRVQGGSVEDQLLAGDAIPRVLIITIDLQLSQETLARLIGSTRQRVNQILQEWHEKRLVEHCTRNVVIRDMDALEALARL